MFLKEHVEPLQYLASAPSLGSAPLIAPFPNLNDLEPVLVDGGEIASINALSWARRANV
jgi:hypothetical protein